MELFNEKRIIYPFIIIILIFAFFIIYFLGNLAQIASEARSRNEEIEKSPPKGIDHIWRQAVLPCEPRTREKRSKACRIGRPGKKIVTKWSQNEKGLRTGNP